MTSPVRTGREDTLPALDRALVLSPAFQARTDVEVPPPALLGLPERAIQFGTGALLRGFVEFFVDEANRRGVFGGRVVMVGSTGSGRDRAARAQDCLFTLSTRGRVEGRAVRTDRVIASLSRALSATDDWDEVLACARDPRISLVFSNTTEVGIALDENDRPGPGAPRSFPGKLTRWLYERATASGFSADAGPLVLPCELIEQNGSRLRAIVLELAERWGYGERFAAWIRDAVPFCDTLVDRIVPGTPGVDEVAEEERSLGYRDALYTVTEAYRLFAIRAEDSVRGRIPFLAADDGIVVTDDVGPYRDRKVRLLNGGHTAMVSAALLLGCETVREAVEDDLAGAFLRSVMLDEIVPGVEGPGAEAFALAVLDRFANPFVRHALADISLQQTMKMRVRVVPSIHSFAARTGRAPEGLALGFAAYLLFQRGDLHARWRDEGRSIPKDDSGERIRALWDGVEADDSAALAALARIACADEALWGTDLSAIPGFADAVARHLVRAAREGMAAALAAHLGAASAPAIG